VKKRIKENEREKMRERELSDREKGWRGTKDKVH
jgi:hypothetical protein